MVVLLSWSSYNHHEHYAPTQTGLQYEAFFFQLISLRIFFFFLIPEVCDLSLGRESLSTQDLETIPLPVQWGKKNCVREITVKKITIKNKQKKGLETTM